MKTKTENKILHIVKSSVKIYATPETSPNLAAGLDFAISETMAMYRHLKLESQSKRDLPEGHLQVATFTLPFDGDHKEELFKDFTELFLNNDLYELQYSDEIKDHINISTHDQYTGIFLSQTSLTIFHLRANEGVNLLLL